MVRGKDIVEHTYNLIRNLPRVSFDTIAPFKDQRKKRYRLSRRGDTRGSNCGLGKNKRDTFFAIGSESKKHPFIIRMPEENYYEKNKYRREYPPLSLRQLQMMIDLDRVDKTKPIDLAAIIRTGLYVIDPLKKHFGVQLTDEGLDNFEAKINIEVQWAPESVIAAIERNGGVITTAYYDVRSLIILSNPKAFFEKGESIPRRLPPPDDAVVYYTGPENRGYLADPEKVSIERLVLAQKYGYELPKIEDDPDYKMLTEKKDPRQIFYGLEPGWVVNLKERVILKSLDPTFNAYFRS